MEIVSTHVRLSIRDANPNAIIDNLIHLYPEYRFVSIEVDHFNEGHYDVRLEKKGAM